MQDFNNVAAHSHMYVVLNFYDQIIFEYHQKDTCLIKTCVLTVLTGF